MADDIGSPDSSRREFVRVALLVGLGAACAGAGAVPLLSTSKAEGAPIAIASMAEILSDEGRFPQLKKIGQPIGVEITITRRDAWRVRSRSQTIYLQRIKAGETVDCFKALSPVCPHAGCSVALGESKFVCPCHNAKFEAGGARAEGPSPRDLDELALSVAKVNGQPWLHVTWQDFVAGVEEKKVRA